MKILFCLLAIYPTLTCASSNRGVLEVGEFSKIYDPSTGEKEKWYINDHCIIRSEDGKWHLFGITHAEPANPIDEDNFAHATADSLTQKLWKKEQFALSVDSEWGEEHLWAPHVIYYNGLYYMFYCAGATDNTKYKIHLATSKDLYKWERHPANPMIVDGYDARDPFILKTGDKWAMYYTATSEAKGGNHTVACRTSEDLIHWGDKKTVFTDPSIGTWGGPTESPTVVRKGKHYYLFIGPRDGYRGTCVYRSDNPFKWTIEDEVARINSHAAEVIRDESGKWYVSHCGWGQGGVYLARLYWKDGLDHEDTSVIAPKKAVSIKADDKKGIGAGGLKSVFKSFVYRKEDKLMDEEGELKFISFNIPNLHYNEDYVHFTETNPWRFTDEFEIRDALEAVRQMGGKVVRTYTLSVKRPDDGPEIPRHVLGPGEFNEEGFKALDKVLEVANEKGIRVIIPFVDNWKWWGGVAEYAGFRGKEKDDFWTDEQLFNDFKKTINFVINRTNTYTGVKYLEDKAVFAWETGNELTCPHEWTQKVCKYIKSIDKNHLVLDGYNTTILRDESINDLYIDVVTTHHYSKNPQETIAQIKQSAAKAKGKKPYFVGEFGFIPTDDVRQVLDAVVETGTKGALIWSLRYRNREGGFYWHSEPYGGDLFKAYHWPGFDSGEPYDERNLMKLMRKKAYEIRDLEVPPLPKPAPPVLLTITDVASISWQGSAGAEHYTVERSSKKAGPWAAVGENICDAAWQYRPLYNDRTAEPGENYYYRVAAVNRAGKSEPSNIAGPVYVKNKTLVDEMQDTGQIFQQKGSLTLECKEGRKFKEDFHRLKSAKGSCIVYKVDRPIHSWKVFSFFENEIADFEFSVSSDGRQFKEIDSDRTVYYTGTGDYDYHKPVLYKGTYPAKDALYLKITWMSQAQVGRVEIAYGHKEPLAFHTHSPVGFIKGFSWGWPGYKGQYLGDRPAESMKKLADTNSEWACISFAAEMETFDKPEILWSGKNPRMVSDTEIRRAIELARKNSLKVVLKPVVNVQDGTWRSWIKFQTEEGGKDLSAWDKWWADFREFLVHYAKMAQETCCEMLCLGCEMGSTEEFESRWRGLVSEIRQIYTGTLTYNANHGREDKITWWDALDVISLSAYFPVGTDDAELALEDDLSNVPPSDSSVKAIKKRWLPIKSRLSELSEEWDRPIFFIELGVCSAQGFSAAPWTHSQSEKIYDGDEQRRYYQATIETFWDQPWFMGFTWWAWPPRLYSLEEAKTHTGFCVYGKPAEKLVREWYKKPR